MSAHQKIPAKEFQRLFTEPPRRGHVQACALSRGKPATGKKMKFSVLSAIALILLGLVSYDPVHVVSSICFGTAGASLWHAFINRKYQTNNTKTNHVRLK